MAHLAQDGGEILGGVPAERRRQRRPDVGGLDGHAPPSLSPARATSSRSPSTLSLVATTSGHGRGRRLVAVIGSISRMPGR
jgi:hypothetical protein